MSGTRTARHSLEGRRSPSLAPGAVDLLPGLAGPVFGSPTPYGDAREGVVSTGTVCGPGNGLGASFAVADEVVDAGALGASGWVTGAAAPPPAATGSLGRFEFLAPTAAPAPAPARDGKPAAWPIPQM